MCVGAGVCVSGAQPEASKTSLMGILLEGVRMCGGRANKEAEVSMMQQMGPTRCSCGHRKVSAMKPSPRWRGSAPRSPHRVVPR